MTEEPPSPPRRPRPGPELRRAALAEGATEAPARPRPAPGRSGGAAPSALDGGPRQSLAAALAAIPDLERDEPAPAPAREPAPGPGPLGPPLPEGTPAAPAVVAGGPPAAELPPVPAGRRRQPAARRHVPWYRTAVFTVLVLGLVASIPVLSWAGVKMIRSSRAGTYTKTENNPKAPGYQARVDPTPVALVVQSAADGTPQGLTLLSLGGTKDGGSIIFVPLATQLKIQAYGADRLSTAYSVSEKKFAHQFLVDRTADVLDVGFSTVIDVDDQQWAKLIQPLGSIKLDNPDSGVVVNGTTLPSGPIELTPDQVGPYLAATRDGESDLNRLNRSEVFWRAWLAAVKAAGSPDVVPGETGSGIRLFVGSLAKGDVDIATLAVSDNPFDPNGPLLPEDEAKVQIADAVPLPISPAPGARPVLRLLNGVEGKTLGFDVIRPFVEAGGVVSTIGNGPRFGQKTTQYIVRDAGLKDRAKLLQAAFGNKGKLVVDPRAPDDVDITVILGSDILDALPGRGTKGGGDVTGGADG